MNKKSKMKKTKIWLKKYLKRQQDINGYARMMLCPRSGEDAIVVFHPDEYQRWIRQGPCVCCPVKNFCDDPCRAYLHWYDQRMSLARQLLG